MKTLRKLTALTLYIVSGLFGGVALLCCVAATFGFCTRTPGAAGVAVLGVVAFAASRILDFIRSTLR